MELRHFRYFVAVAEESSLGRAAHRLHVSQPALSQQISDLEDELGLKLFTRNARGVELTEAGRVFLIAGRRVLVAVKEAAERAQEAAKGERGRLVIGILGAVTVSFLSGVLSRFRLDTSNGCVGFANNSAPRPRPAAGRLHRVRR
jgi:DNA-binding transcriptional LysR family regulator